MVYINGPTLDISHLTQLCTLPKIEKKKKKEFRFLPFKNFKEWFVHKQTII